MISSHGAGWFPKGAIQLVSTVQLNDVQPRSLKLDRKAHYPQRFSQEGIECRSKWP